MTDAEAVTLEADLDDEDAEHEIEQAIGGRHSIARKYVLRLRRRHPNATPDEIVRILERHYSTSITAAGMALTAAELAAEVGISLIPGGGAAAVGVKAAGQRATKKVVKAAGTAVAKKAARSAAKNIALGAAKSSAQKLSQLLPAGDQQLQFEITAIFGLAIADIHGMDLDHDQAHALIYGLTNERVSQQQIARMAADFAMASSPVDGEAGQALTTAHTDRTHWASTLADALPSGAAQSLVRTVQTGQLDTVRAGFNGKQQTTIDYGVAAVADGVTRFRFGRDIVNPARIAFPALPDEFPAHLAIPQEAAYDAEESDDEPNRAIAALEEAAKATGTWIIDAAETVGDGVAIGAATVGSGVATGAAFVGGGVTTGAAAIGSGVANAAGAATRSFRHVDIDGDGIPDEPQALTAVKGIGGAITGATGALGGSVAGLFKSKKRE